MQNTKVWITSYFLFSFLLCFCLLYPFESMAMPPYCSEVCDGDISCNYACTNDYGKAITCYQWGICDFSSLIQTSITIAKAYPYAFPDPYGFGLRMEYRITLAKGHEAVSVTTQYSPDGGVTWHTDEQSRPPKYDWDNIHGDIECGSAKYNLASNQTYSLRVILNYRVNGSTYHKTSNYVTATVEDYDPAVLYENVGHIPEESRVNWQNAGLLSESRSGLFPETPAFADNVFNVTSMPGADLDARLSEAIERARRAWRDFNETSIIYFPPGRHRIMSPIVLTAGDSNIIFQGAGADGSNATILECHVGKDGTCFNVSGSVWGSPVYDLGSLISGDIEKADQVLVASLPRCPTGVNDPSCFAEGDWIHFWEASFPAQSGAVVGQITQLESLTPDVIIKDKASKKYSRKYDLKVQKVRPVTNIGIENLKIYRSDSPKSTENQYGSGNNIKFQFAVNCWVRGVESELTCRHHVVMSRCSHIEISGCYLHVARFYGGNSYGYGLVLGESTTNCLIENNLFRRLRHAMGIGTGANSNVFTFNYSREQHSTYSWWIFKDIVYADSDICLHGRYPYANLFEHNIVEFIEADDAHGNNGPYNAFVRNFAYADRIELYSAPHAAVLGCDTNQFPGLSAWGNTSLSMAAYGKTYLVGGKFVSYENAPWISYFDGSFWYHPDTANFAMLKDISYFYTSRPYFLSSKYTWPSIGPDLDNPFLKEGEYDRQISQTIPAADRYKAGYETYISNFTRVAP
jgi:hypothetical protein